jgi:ABC-type bacteriocin/lantibiotic exporter with double-glycine peptidase domain
MLARKALLYIVLFFSLIGFCLVTTLGVVYCVGFDMPLLIVAAAFVGGCLWTLTDPMYIIAMEEEIEREQERNTALHALIKSITHAKERNERMLRLEIERLKLEKEKGDN